MCISVHLQIGLHRHLYNLSHDIETGIALSCVTSKCVFNQNLVLLIYVFCIMYVLYGEGRDSSVGTATGYGLDDPGFESRCGRDFTHPSRPAEGPTQPSIQWVSGISRGLSGRGVALTIHSSLALRLKKEYSDTSTSLLGFRGLF